MPSILPGYEYDIFISYRQKDNKTGWVNKFVENLKIEIEAIFKEEVSIYFDSNPHNGINETHDVDGSLKEKMKCLVFIPIVSQTYCDPQSFAWKNELLPFLEFTRQDTKGLDVKLRGGNVAKRVLPVLIHEIDQEDVQLFEKQIGGAMRPVDFIYKASGVNRPLRSIEEHPDDSIYRTIYRDQINKVANAIKDIINGMVEPSVTGVDTNNLKNSYVAPGKPKRSIIKKAPIIYLSIAALIIIFTVLTFINNNSVPLVLLMDGTHPVRVYDEETVESGGTNADAISDILLDLPIKRQRETISPSWHRHEEMLAFKPELIIVHYSGFRQEDSSGPREQLKLLIEYFIESDTKFLIYSRQVEHSLRSTVDDLLSDLYAKQPDLKGRVNVFGLLDYGKPIWRDPAVSGMLKMRVKEILNLQN